MLFVIDEFYKDRKEAALIINNLNLVKLDDTKTKKQKSQQSSSQQEADYIILDNGIRALINIECKAKIGKYEGEPESKWPSTKVEKQMKKVREIVGDSFQTDVKGPWKVFSIAYCQKLDKEFEDCPTCRKFIAKGKDELMAILKSIFSEIEKEIEEMMKQLHGNKIQIRYK